MHARSVHPPAAAIGNPDVNDETTPRRTVDGDHRGERHVNTAGIRPDLDFLIIGAQKAATTTVHHWLKQHPDLCLPAGKETPFYHQNPSNGDVRRFLDETFSDHRGRLCGKATPQYMCQAHTADTLWRHHPDVKLIAILRDPVERARSHWKMRVRIGDETRTFKHAVIDQLADQTRADTPISETDGYLAFGEYGRTLERYLRHFRREQLLILQDTETASDPNRALQAITEHLQVAPISVDNPERRYNSGPAKQRLIEKLLWKIVPYDTLHRIVPANRRQKIGEMLDRYGINRPETTLDETLDAATLQMLQDHFIRDANLLAARKIDAPWLDRWAAGR